MRSTLDLLSASTVIGVNWKLLGDARALHVLAEMRKTAQEHGMVVTVAIAAAGDASETPTVCLTNEGRKFSVFKVRRLRETKKISHEE